MECRCEAFPESPLSLLPLPALSSLLYTALPDNIHKSQTAFPSGHTTAAFTSAVVLWHINHIFGVGAFLFAVMIAFSRIYLAVHYTTDVLAGAIIGSLSAFAVIAVARRKHLLPQ